MIDSIEAFDHYEKFIDNAGSQDDEYNNERMTLNFLLGILFRKDISFDDLFLNRLLLPNSDLIDAYMEGWYTSILNVVGIAYLLVSIKQTLLVNIALVCDS